MFIFRKDGSKEYSPDQVDIFKKKAAEENKEIEPYVGLKTDLCGTCGSTSLAHPITSFCFLCNTDNWRHTEY